MFLSPLSPFSIHTLLLAVACYFYLLSLTYLSRKSQSRLCQIFSTKKATKPLPQLPYNNLINNNYKRIHNNPKTLEKNCKTQPTNYKQVPTNNYQSAKKIAKCLNESTKQKASIESLLFLFLSVKHKTRITPFYTFTFSISRNCSRMSLSVELWELGLVNKHRTRTTPFYRLLLIVSFFRILSLLPHSPKFRCALCLAPSLDQWTYFSVCKQAKNVYSNCLPLCNLATYQTYSIA